MDSDSRRETSKQTSGSLGLPACVHLYVWVFMIMISVSPMLLLTHGGSDRLNGLESFVITVMIQVGLWVTQRRCTSEDLSYWEGLLIAAASVTTGENLTSIFRVFCLLFAVVILSVLFAAEHDQRYAALHAELRFGKLIISLFRQRWPKKQQS